MGVVTLTPAWRMVGSIKKPAPCVRGAGCRTDIPGVNDKIASEVSLTLVHAR